MSSCVDECGNTSNKSSRSTMQSLTSRICLMYAFIKSLPIISLRGSAYVLTYYLHQKRGNTVKTIPIAPAAVAQDLAFLALMSAASPCLSLVSTLLDVSCKQSLLPCTGTPVYAAVNRLSQQYSPPSLGQVAPSLASHPLAHAPLRAPATSHYHLATE